MNALYIHWKKSNANGTSRKYLNSSDGCDDNNGVHDDNGNDTNDDVNVNDNKNADVDEKSVDGCNDKMILI